MVPGLAGLVMRRGRVETFFIRAAPFRLALQFCTVAGRAMFDIEVAPVPNFGICSSRHGENHRRRYQKGHCWNLERDHAALAFCNGRVRRVACAE